MGPVRSERAAALRGLYAITPETEDTAWLAARVQECLEGGARIVQYRAKGLRPAAALEQARRLARACRAAGVALIVNDSVALALECSIQSIEKNH